jgi:hypothetical protein
VKPVAKEGANPRKGQLVVGGMLGRAGAGCTVPVAVNGIFGTPPADSLICRMHDRWLFFAFLFESAFPRISHKNTETLHPNNKHSRLNIISSEKQYICIQQMLHAYYCANVLAPRNLMSCRSRPEFQPCRPVELRLGKILTNQGVSCEALSLVISERLISPLAS